MIFVYHLISSTTYAQSHECQDSSDWVNNHGLTCEHYNELKYCLDNKLTSSGEKLSGHEYNYPTLHCCNCGRGASGPNYF